MGQLEGLESAQPVIRLTPMMGNGQNLDKTTDFAVDEIKGENIETHAAKGGGVDDPVPVRSLAGSGQDSSELRVVAPAKTNLLVFIVDDLFLMLRRRFGV